MMGGNGGEDWDALLDRLSACITSLEAAAVRRAAVDRGSPSHLRQLHNLVAGLLVKHRLTTWNQLRTSFPGYGTHDSEAGNDALGLHEGERRQTETDESRKCGEGERQGGGSVKSHSALDDPDRAGTSSQVASAGEHTIGRKRRPEAQPRGAKSRAKRATTGPMDDQRERMEEVNRTLADFPRIVSWWHPTKNGTSLPANYTHGSSQRVWLQCPGCPDCGEVHQWDAKAYSLTKYDFGCPSCSTKGGPGAVCSCRAISSNERLAAEWHEDNPSASTVHQGSGKKYKWRCADAACGHVWEAQPANRSKAGGGSGTSCPACYERRCMKHPSVAVGRPELLAEWDYERNMPLLASELRCGSNKLVWWLCQKCKWSWQAAVHHRALGRTGCPKCRWSK